MINVKFSDLLGKLKELRFYGVISKHINLQNYKLYQCNVKITRAERGGVCTFTIRFLLF